MPAEVIFRSRSRLLEFEYTEAVVDETVRESIPRVCKIFPTGSMARTIAGLIWMGKACRAF